MGHHFLSAQSERSQYEIWENLSRTAEIRRRCHNGAINITGHGLGNAYNIWDLDFSHW